MALIKSVDAVAYKIPTAAPESDGTYAWDHTTLVLVQVTSENQTGIGYTYADAATAQVVSDSLKPAILGGNALSSSGLWEVMVAAIRNLGRPGIASMAISAVDIALWDLKAKLLDLPLLKLLKGTRDSVPIYGSGGFTSYNDQQLTAQFGGWANEGFKRVKMKVGRHPQDDPRRVRLAREAIGPEVELFVDANGAFHPREAIDFAHQISESDVSWFEEPVTSDDLPGMQFVRQHMPAGIAVAAGEYGYDLPYFERMLSSGSIDCLQADVTRCGGITGFLQVVTLCRAHSFPLSAHCAPAAHLAAACSSSLVQHLEYFFDHARIEQMLFDGVAQPRDGQLTADSSRPGLGLEFKQADAEQFRIN